MENLILIKSSQELQQLKDYTRDKNFIAFDSETTGVKRDSKIVGFSIAAEVNIGYYVVLSYWDKDKNQLLDTGITKEEVIDFLITLKGAQLIMHNGIFDCSMVYENYRVSLIESLHTDTLILGQLLDENRHNGLKELGVSIFGANAKDEQTQTKESVLKNGGKLTKDCYELYKADSETLGRYGAKDAVLTLKLFYLFVEQLFEQGLDKFFYEEESMPMLRSSTYDLNTTGLKVDVSKLMELKKILEAECFTAKALIYKEITPIVSEKYPATKPINTFNIGSSKQLAWLLFIKLHNEFFALTKEGREVCKALDLKLPYTMKAKREFVDIITQGKGNVYQEAAFNPKTKKMGRPKKLGDVWNYLAADKAQLKKYSDKYVWVKHLLEYSKNQKLLNTYVDGILERQSYNIINPSFLQHGTTSGRYSSKNPNFQNLPRDDKRIKSCIVARPGNVFIGADYSQLEPRVFASFSGDERLLNCFKDGDDFYSVIGAEVYGIYDCSLKKNDVDSFANKHKKKRDVSKAVALAATYGTTAPKMAMILDISIAEANEIIDNYFKSFPKVKTLMLKSHELAKAEGKAVSRFGRIRHMPKAKLINQVYGKVEHKDLPYEIRNTLNLSVNHRIQSTGASIINRAAIECWNRCKELSTIDNRWAEVKIVMQVHDELILEGPEALGSDISNLLKDCMESTNALPGVDLVAEPKIAKNLADLK